MMLAIGLLYMAFNMLTYASSIPSLSNTFNTNGYFLSNTFSLSIKRAMLFLSLNLCDKQHLLIYICCTIHDLWNETSWPWWMIFLILSWITFYGISLFFFFYIYVHHESWLIFFYCVIFWFCYQSNNGFIKIVWKPFFLFCLIE